MKKGNAVRFFFKLFLSDRTIGGLKFFIHLCILSFIYFYSDMY